MGSCEWYKAFLNDLDWEIETGDMAHSNEKENIFCDGTIRQNGIIYSWSFFLVYVIHVSFIYFSVCGNSKRFSTVHFTISSCAQCLDVAFRPMISWVLQEWRNSMRHRTMIPVFSIAQISMIRFSLRMRINYIWSEFEESPQGHLICVSMWTVRFFLLTNNNPNQQINWWRLISEPVRQAGRRTSRAIKHDQ
jgi:hypothetical protein